MVKIERQTIAGARVRPDLTLFAQDVKPMALIEVVDTHFPEQEVFAQELPVIVVSASFPLLHALRDNKISPLEVKEAYNVACVGGEIPSFVHRDPRRGRMDTESGLKKPPFADETPSRLLSVWMADGEVVGVRGYEAATSLITNGINTKNPVVEVKDNWTGNVVYRNGSLRDLYRIDKATGRVLWPSV